MFSNFDIMSGQVDTIEGKKAILESLETYYGIVTDSCKAIGLNRSTFYKWLETDPEFKLAVDEIQEVALDFVEGKLFERIKGVMLEGAPGVIYQDRPSDAAIALYLKTKGKKRGYIERSEQSFVDKEGNNIQPTISINIVHPPKDI